MRRTGTTGAPRRFKRHRLIVQTQEAMKENKKNEEAKITCGVQEVSSPSSKAEETTRHNPANAPIQEEMRRNHFSLRNSIGSCSVEIEVLRNGRASIQLLAIIQTIDISNA